ncbi:MAG TPA: PAS domain-containing protein [Thermodesulfovibrionales bacterium]|nr:PAS domain-containing protein [Thermodesulfovibrionales bacterium]
MKQGGMRESKGISIQPIGLLLILIASIFATSAFVNLLLSIFSPLSIDLKFSLLDSGLLVVILFPVVYYLVYEPLTSSIKGLARSEEALQESEEKFRSLVETTDDAIYVVNRNCEYLFMNARHRGRMNVLFEGEYRGKNFSEFHGAEDSAVFSEKVNDVFNTGEPLQQELRSKKDGRYFLRTFSPIKGPGKEVRAVSIVSREITMLKKESEAQLRYSAIFEQSPYGIVIIDRKGHLIEFNETAHRDLGYSRSEFARLSIADIDPVQTEEEIQSRISEVLKKGHAEFDVRHKTKGGDIRDVQVRTRVLDLFGDKYLQAIWQDITDRKRAERDLELYRQILASMAEGVLLIRVKDGVIVYTNPKLEEMFGYAQGELAGRHVSLLNAPTEKSPEETAQTIMNALHQNGVWTGEILNIKKDGTPFWCHAVVSTFEHDVHGSVWISIHQDITDRKR